MLVLAAGIISRIGTAGASYISTNTATDYRVLIIYCTLDHLTHSLQSLLIHYCFKEKHTSRRGVKRFGWPHQPQHVTSIRPMRSAAAAAAAASIARQVNLSFSGKSNITWDVLTWRSTCGFQTTVGRIDYRLTYCSTSHARFPLQAMKLLRII